MALVVLDTDVLIAYLSRDDANHAEAVERMNAAVASGTRRVVSAVSYTELLVGPLATGGDAAKTVNAALDRLGIEIAPVDANLAQRAAGVRADTKLGLPDAFVVATALSEDEARIESFDRRLNKAFAGLTG